LFRLSRPPAALFNCSFISDVRTFLKQNTETVLGFFQPRVEKYANEAEIVSVFYLKFYFTMCDGLYRRPLTSCSREFGWESWGLSLFPEKS